MTHEEKQIHNTVHAELREFEEFKTLVRKMREAQRYRDMCCDDCTDACVYEYHVDEYLKKMEDEE